MYKSKFGDNQKMKFKYQIKIMNPETKASNFHCKQN